MLNTARCLARLAIATCPLVFLTPVNAQQKIDTIKIIVGYPPGGASDRAARLVGDALREKLGATVVVENKTGAGGRVAAQGFRATPANETALMIGNPAVNVVAPHVFKNVGYDPLKDFVPVAQVSRYEFGVAVGPAVPVKEIDSPARVAARQSGQSQLRRAGHRQPAAFLCADAGRCGESEAGGRRLSRLCAAADRFDRRSIAGRCRHARHTAAAARRRQDSHPRDRRRQARARIAERADVERSGTRRRRRRLECVLRTGLDACRRACAN